MLRLANPWLFVPKTRPKPKILKPQPQNPKPQPQINNPNLQRRICQGRIVRLPRLAQAYWVTNSLDMNSFNVLFGKWEEEWYSERAKQGGPGLFYYIINRNQKILWLIISLLIVCKLSEHGNRWNSGPAYINNRHSYMYMEYYNNKLYVYQSVTKPQP